MMFCHLAYRLKAGGVIAVVGVGESWHQAEASAISQIKVECRRLKEACDGSRIAKSVDQLNGSQILEASRQWAAIRRKYRAEQDFPENNP